MDKNYFKVDEDSNPRGSFKFFKRNYLTLRN